MITSNSPSTHSEQPYERHSEGRQRGKTSVRWLVQFLVLAYNVPPCIVVSSQLALGWRKTIIRESIWTLRASPLLPPLPSRWPSWCWWCHWVVGGGDDVGQAALVWHFTPPPTPLLWLYLFGEVFGLSFLLLRLLLLLLLLFSIFNFYFGLQKRLWSDVLFITKTVIYIFILLFQS